jgi:hypothetical protein
LIGSDRQGNAVLPKSRARGSLVSGLPTSRPAAQQSKVKAED